MTLTGTSAFALVSGATKATGSIAPADRGSIRNV
jgi:hypothetical protein